MENPTPRKPEEDVDLAEPVVPTGAEPIETETGLASWYGPPYHNRRGSNGEFYNMHAMTAAHRTFPLGSIVRVTNLKSGNSVLVRITDRGPFIPGRIVDLSLAAARKLDVWQAGTAQVKVELMQSGAAPGTVGKWAVQIGGMPDEGAATKLADHLTRRYHTANVVRYQSPTGDWWIRVRVLDDAVAWATAQRAADERPRNLVAPAGTDERPIEIPWCLARYRGEPRLLDVGYSHMILIPSIPSVPASLRQDWLTRFARDVMPHFRR